MDFNNISSIQYLFELNHWPQKFDDRDIAFLNKIRPELFKKCLNTFLEKINSTDGSDIHLRYFYSQILGEYMKGFSNGLTLLIFPLSGEIKKYWLNKNGEFLTDIHRNPDPILITRIETGLYIDPNRTDAYFFNQRKHKVVQNKIDSVALFKKNPVINKSQYEGFEDFLKHR